MTESYQSRGDSDHTYRSSHRRIDPTAYYSRAAPYGYYERGRQDVRQPYVDHHAAHAAIQDGETTNQGDQQQRRRISVAVRMRSISKLQIMTYALIVRPLQKTQDQVFWRSRGW
jgi:hypothetical protein